jgi:alginate O-acetyltransferase complex protein AlgJ
MALMTRARRPLALVLTLALTLPALLMTVTPVETVSRLENRVLAPAPAWPDSVAGWARLPRAIDAYLSDHFAFRQPLLLADLRLQKKLGGHAGVAAAVEGRDGWLFLSDGLLQSTGRILDPAQADDYAAFVCTVEARLRLRGARTVFTLAPSPGEIYPEKAPAWAGPARRPTDYDRVVAGVRRCGVTALDLRRVLISAKPQGRLYRATDSHWTPRAWLLGYDALAAAMGRTDWLLPAERSSWQAVDLTGGDLPRLAGLETRTERVEIHDWMHLPPEARKAPIGGVTSKMGQPFLVETGRAGPTVLIVGDSFTVDSLPPLFARFAGKVAWIHQDECGFDWRVIERVKPDYVLLAASEREARCRRGRPLNMPAQ